MNETVNLPKISVDKKRSNIVILNVRSWAPSFGGNFARYCTVLKLTVGSLE